MSVIRTGSNKKFADGWDKIFKGKTAKKPASATKSTKKKAAKKAAPKKAKKKTTKKK